MNMMPLRLLLLIAIGCPGGKESALLCEDPQTILLTDGSNSGFERCADEAVNRVSDQPIDPVNSGPRCVGDEDVQNCSTDADCTEGPHGACIHQEPDGWGMADTAGGPSCSCEYACSKDADCETGAICVPDELSPNATRPVCVPATCDSSEDCSSGECGLSAFHNGCWWVVTAICRDDGDGCHADAECEDACAADTGGEDFVCQTTSCAIGRPLLVEGEARVAGVVQRGDWTTSSAIPLPTPGSCAQLAAYWNRVAALEHASVGSFARFTLQLLALGAPAELLSATQVAAGDEIRHARFAYGLASTFAGKPQGPGPLAMDKAGSSFDPQAVLYGLIDEACIGETLGAAELRAAAELADPTLRGTLLQMAEEEGQHAALAWKSLRWLLQIHPELRPLARQGLEVGMARHRASAHSMAPQPGLERWGVHPAAGEVHLQTLARVVAPVVRALFEEEGASALC